MRGRDGRVSVWKLLLPFPLAALIVTAVGIGLRHCWHSAPPPSLNAPLAERPAAGGETLIPAQLASPPRSQEVALPSATAPHGASARWKAQPGQGDGRQEIRTHPSARNGQAAFSHSFGPAPEPVAPSLEAAPRVSLPPPAAVSAPRVAPAPHLALIPTPGPGEELRVEPPTAAQPLARAWAKESMRSVRFDAGYYYGRGRSAGGLAEELTRSWAEKGVNLVYFYAYNRVYGARYLTRYPGNIMEDYGRQDLLGEMLSAAHRRGIKVIAWFYGPQHKQVWEAHPEWRQKGADGKDYKLGADGYALCVRKPEVMKWWLGLVDELLRNYPELDGVDIAEAQVDTWGDHACHCQHCREQFAEAHPGEKPGGAEWRKFRAAGLSRVLLATSRLAHGHGKEAHLTTVFTAREDGTLMAPNLIRDATGFDLEAILASRDRPEVIQAELIWQQWAATYHAYGTFSPEWTRSAVRQAKDQVKGRARLIAHLEVTDFGSGGLDGPKIGTTVAAAVEAEPYGVDIYDAHLLERTEGASRHLQMAWLDF